MSEKKRNRDDRPNTEQDEERSPRMEEGDQDERQTGQNEEFEEAGMGQERSTVNPPRKKK